MHEATLVLGMLLQRFELIDHTDYHLQLKHTLTIKPSNFKIKVRSRTPLDFALVELMVRSCPALSSPRQCPPACVRP